jgi:hypothetical protein
VSTFQPAELVYSTDFRPGFHTVGVVVDGAFIPLADPPSGHVRTRAAVAKKEAEAAASGNPAPTA